MLIKRLANHALGKVEMSPTQVRAAEVLIRKTLPDLRATEHTGEGGGPIQYAAKPFEFAESETAEET